jgi:glucoamylase
MQVQLLLLAALLFCVCGQQCEVAESSRSDCGYLGINQAECQAKGCCWRPTGQPRQLQGVPWCYFPSGPNVCSNITYDWAGGMGFDSAFYAKMYGFFDANIDIQGKGGIVAAPDFSTPIGSYYYHWMRDAALTMRTYLELNDFDLSKVEKKFKSYVNWVRKVQNETDPQGFDIRINPKF